MSVGQRSDTFMLNDRPILKTKSGTFILLDDCDENRRQATTRSRWVSTHEIAECNHLEARQVSYAITRQHRVILVPWALLQMLFL